MNWVMQELIKADIAFNCSGHRSVAHENYNIDEYKKLYVKFWTDDLEDEDSRDMTAIYYSLNRFSQLNCDIWAKGFRDGFKARQGGSQ